MITNDLFLKQINEMIKMVNKIVFESENLEYEKQNNENDLVYEKLINLINNGKINEAEDYLFDSINLSDMKFLKIGLLFYKRLNEYDNDELKKFDFTRREIKSGLEDILDEYGVNFTGIM
ncbi:MULTISPECIES: DUF6483 family protein [Peptoniphilus]|uniref:DUF6483 family protein n=1 Tax=Peptoniphilus TaxID=162289 RepID=UPI0001DA99E8|nr:MULTISPECIES: DUF6483 family protein [Peptoniphilus]EFI41794.1 hypothetical protein HMPREF0629_00420 [Peptoniphilus sp. oral taxon 386 str. F0131]